MLIRSSVKAMLMLWNRGDNVFSPLPRELIRAIKYLPTPDKDFLEALYNVAFGEFDLLKAMLEHAKAKADKRDLMRLLLQAADVMTPAGKLIEGVTLLECALGAGDFEMAKMIKPYFYAFNGGKKEFEVQRDRYRSCIATMMNQQHDYDFTWLVDILIKSSRKDVAAELASGDQFDSTYQSPLRDAMNQVRKDLLDPQRRIIKKPSMHCNYQNFAHVDELLYRESDKLKEGTNSDKLILLSCQIYGLLQLIELTAYDRCVLAQDQLETAMKLRPINRSFNYKNPLPGSDKTFPVFSDDLLSAHSGVGFSSWVSDSCARHSGRCFTPMDLTWGVQETFFPRLRQAKVEMAEEFYSEELELAPTSPTPH